ncbi:hypothetical protein VPG91_11680 [Nitrospirillum amazonense]|uniref:hypothetical protein n=1 Tax=Nitrospirillum amazonense TaxID=28077 RepID=UPI002DD42EA8|nr:hypothetical protein [Nitrospirillum amazonense]MEC4591650.1 hypothetical protein [Nitrospirillum amazonense]
MNAITVPSSIPHDPWAAALVWRWYSTRLVKGGPPVAAELQLIEERDPATGELLADQIVVVRLNGDESRLGADWPRNWPWRPISEAECRFQAQDATWARRHAPALPIANPTRRAALADAPIPFL